MKDNKEILNEVFFKKKLSGIDKFKSNLPTYAPVNNKTGAFEVTDANEVKKRLAGTFGVTFGNNSVKSMASRAIKSFPIVISDNVDPETAVMLKRLMEEQYADYINLLVSNQVVDLADYSSSEDGNIAIQALDKLSGTDFSRTRLADKAANTGKLDRDDTFANMPLYSLLKEEQKELKTGNPIFDALLEDAIVIPDEYKENLKEFIECYADDIAELNEATAWVAPGAPTSMVDAGEGAVKDQKGNILAGNTTTFQKYLMDIGNEKQEDLDAIVNRDTVSAAKRGLIGMDKDNNEIYNRLTTADIVVDKNMLDAAINKSVGDILTDPKNVEIRDRFEKATFLLQSRRIAGIEYYNYLTLRLGIPVSDRARKELMQQFKISDVRDYTKGDVTGPMATRYRLTPEDQAAIAANRRITQKVVRLVTRTKLRGFIVSMAHTTGLAGVGAAAYGIPAAILGWAMTPIGWFALGGALIGAGAMGIAHIVRRIKKKKLENLEKNSKIFGWERVEALIEQMYEAQKSLQYKVPEEVKKEDPDIRANMLTFQNMLRKEQFLAESVKGSVDIESDTFDEIPYLTEDFAADVTEIITEANEEAAKDENLVNEFLTESLFTKVFGKKSLGGTSMPTEVKYIEKKTGKDAIIIPQFMAAQRFAYGSSEFERRDAKDRKYNQPLIMTVKFKERFSDGKFSDNELTAVIGILGKIIRVPSEEMEYILSENLKDNTIEGFLKDPSGSLNNMISDMIGAEKISREAKKLPQSADLWKNLEKVATLAAANKLAGKKTNNIANAHIVFSQKEIDTVRNETGIDYLKNAKFGLKLMKRYSAFTLMVANDAGMRLHTLDGQDSSNWEVVPYSAIAGRDGGDQINAALTKLARLSE